MTIKSAILAAALGAAMFAAPASAESPGVRVSYADLDLTTPAGVAELEKRVKRAAWRLCKFSGEGAMRDRLNQVRCYRAARQTSAVQIAQATERQKQARRAA